MTKPRVINIVLYLFLSALAQAEAAPDCGACQVKVEERAKVESSKQLHESLLAKNKAYLSALRPDQVSGAVKVRSNILVFDLRIEAMKNNLLALNQELQEKGCNACPKK